MHALFWRQQVAHSDKLYPFQRSWKYRFMSERKGNIILNRGGENVFRAIKEAQDTES